MEKNAPVINVVLCNTDEVYYSFAIAAITAWLKIGMDPIIITDVSPTLLGSDDVLKTRVAEELAKFQYGKPAISSKKRHAPPYPEKVRFFLINIGPGNDRDTTNIMTFIDNHETEIVLWIDAANHWFWTELNYINQYRNIVEASQESTPLQLLKRRGCTSVAYWQETEEALISGDDAKINSHLLAKRYASAYRVAAVLDDNIWNDNKLSCLLGAVDELTYRYKNEGIEYLNRLFPRMMEKTEKAKIMMSDSSRFFEKAKKINRPVGYVNLGALSDLMDVDAILNYGMKKFPWLCIVEYSVDGEKYLEAASAKTNIDSFINGSIKGHTIELNQIKMLLNKKIMEFREDEQPQKLPNYL